MKKIGTIFIILVLSSITGFLIFSNTKTPKPNTYYQVYLDNKLLGMVKSKKKLEQHINKQGEKIKNNIDKYTNKIEIIDNTRVVLNSIQNEETKNLTNKQKVNYIIKNKKRFGISDIKINYLKQYLYNKLNNITDEQIAKMKKYIIDNEVYKNIKNVYAPKGIEIQKIKTYKKDIITTSDMYKKIISYKSPTVDGYEFTIKKDKKEVNIYVTEPQIFLDAVDSMAIVFVGKDNYEKYKTKTQSQILTTGSTIENVYVQEDITYKATNISIEEKIYTDATELSKYLLYGDEHKQKIVKVKSGQSISKIAYENEISVEEFLISNPEYTSRDNLLYEGKEVVISKINPQINIIEETHSINDIQTNYSIVEQYDSSLNQGSAIVTQNGERGVERVTQNVKTVNGQIVYVQPVSKETVKAPVSKVITLGTKQVATVGSTASWGWPTNSGYTITSYYGYRFSPFGGYRELHTGLDIAGTGYGSPVYATNNGTVESVSRTGSYGYNIIINHGNGYWTLYAHMSRFAAGIKVGTVVSRGNVVGYVGTTGAATGPHLHYEIRKGCSKYGCYVDPLPYYR